MKGKAGNSTNPLRLFRLSGFFYFFTKVFQTFSDNISMIITNKEKLMRKAVERIAKETGKTEIEVLTDMQTGAAKLNDNETLKVVTGLKNIILTEMGIL